MGSLLISVPDIADHDLVYGERETRQILKLFWPHQGGRIDRVAITTDARCLAQTALVAAIDASQAMGYIEGSLRALLSQDHCMRALGRRLAQRYMAHWWRHTSRRDLMDAHVHDAVRDTLSLLLRPRLQDVLNGIPLPRPILGPWYLGEADAMREAS